MKFIILGSCVSRDAFWMTDTSHEVVGYLAKNSLCTSLRGRPFPLSLKDLNPQESLKDDFLLSCLRTNLEGSAPDLVLGLKDKADAILIDLIDERIPLLEWDGAWATYCTSLRGMLPADNADLLLPEAPERLEMFRTGIGRLAEIAADAELPIYLNPARWAPGAASGGGKGDVLVGRMNSLLERLEGLCTPFITARLDYEGTAFEPDPEHRWGPAPFHYRAESYRALIRSIDRL